MFKICSQSVTVATTIGLSLGLGLMVDEVKAAPLFSSFQTGSQLLSNPNVSFPTTSPILNGNSIDFLAGGNPQDALLTWDLLPAESRGSLDIFIAIDFTPISNDSDPYATIIDGINGQGIARAENNGGRAIRVNLEDITNTGFGSVLQEDNDEISGLGVVEPFSFILSVNDNILSSASIRNYTEGSQTFPEPIVLNGTPIDPDLPLSFGLYRDRINGQAESYTINSIEVIINSVEQQQVPEPTSVIALLMITGVGSLLTINQR